MARCLIVGCGCRGLALTSALLAEGHVVRATTRDPSRLPDIRAAGAEAFVGDPDRVATLASALPNVTVVCLLLGSATGDRTRLAALHGTRLAMLLERMLDTAVRGVVYERDGSVDRGVLAAGADRVAAACERSMTPYALVDADPGDHRRWLAATVAGVERVLSA